MAINLLQSNNTVTTTNGPVSVTPTLSATTAGNLLLLAVVVTGTGPTIATPAGWSVANSFNNATIAAALLYIVNNAGGITSVAVTITATAGGASASLYEFSGVGSLQALDYNSNQANVGTNTLSFTFPVVSRVGELSAYLVGSQAPAAFTPNNSPEWSANTASGVSTGATTNASLNFFWAQNIGPGTPQILGGTLGASVSWVDIGARFFTGAGGGITRDTIGGNAGILVGQYMQGVIGG